MRKIADTLKGIAIGVSNVVAGLSGGTIAVVLGVYQKIINACSNIIKHPIDVLKKYWKLFLGIIIGVLLGVVGIKKLYEVAPLPTSLFFCGLIIAEIPALFRVVKLHKANKYDFIIFTVALLIIIGMPFLTDGADKLLELNVGNCFILVALGIVSAASMIVPGISGSMVLASIGFYKPILDLFTSTIKSLLKLEFASLGSNIVLCLCFGIGCIIGIVLIANIIKTLFNKFFKQSYFAILGLVSGSAVSIITVCLRQQNLFNSLLDVFMWIGGLFTLALGLLLGRLLVRFQKAREEKENFFLEAAKEMTPKALEETIKLLKFKTILDQYNPKSNAPFGQENKKALEFMMELGKKEGFVVKNVDNYAMHIEYGPQGAPLIGILAHLDVVPVTNNWLTNPFEPKIIDGKIYARGAIDDKGPLMASLYALKIIKESKLPVTKRIRLICGCDEESGSRCLEHYFKTEEMPITGFSPDAEFPLIFGEKANCSFDIIGKLINSPIVSFTAGERYNVVPGEACMELNIDLAEEYLAYLATNNYKGEYKNNKYIAYGVSVHAMTPQNGVNAAYILFDFLSSKTNCPLAKYVNSYYSFDPFGEKLGISYNDPIMKELTMNMGIIRVENGSVRLGLNLRVPCDELEENIKSQVSKSLADFPMFKLSFGHFAKRHYVDPKSEIVNKLMDAYQQITNDLDSKPFTIGGGTYAKFIENAVAFGPLFVGREDVVHQDNEYFSIDDFTTSMAIYAKAIYELIK